MHQLKVETEYEWTEHPVSVTQVSRCDGQPIGQAKAIKFSRTRNTFTAIVGIGHLFLSVMKAVLKYMVALELQYCVTLAHARIKNIVDDMMSARYLPKESRSSYVRYVRYGRLSKKIFDVLALWKLLNDSRENCVSWVHHIQTSRCCMTLQIVLLLR